MRLPEGFRAAGISAGLKESGRPDLGVLVVEEPAAWAFTGTTNLVRAACVDRNRARFETTEAVRAVVVNSGNANCATGVEGARNNEDFAAAAAVALGLTGAHEVLTASTGVVGRQLPLERIRSSLPDLAAASSQEVDAFAQAILTTDSVAKMEEIDLPGGGRIVGVAKGSGMIHPNMATMLAFVLTDVEVASPELRESWSEIVSGSFNQITVDGDTSPNDMALVLASGRRRADPDEFDRGLAQVCRRLAQKIARDGEGATKLLQVEVSGARDVAEARAAARTVAGSPLVKAAVHGNDPNWGRILVALGRSGASFDPGDASITLQGTPVYRAAPVDFDEATVSAALAASDVVIAVDLGAGSGSAEAWGCDLSADYVRINADYTT